MIFFSGESKQKKYIKRNIDRIFFHNICGIYQKNGNYPAELDNKL